MRDRKTISTVSLPGSEVSLINTEAEELLAYLLSRCIQEDLIQDVILAYLKHPTPISNPRIWAWKRLEWLRVDEARRAKVVRSGSHYLPETTVIRPEASPLRVAEANQALSRVEPAARRQGDILALFVLGWTYKELAAYFRIPEGTVMSRLSQARKKVVKGR